MAKKINDAEYAAKLQAANQALRELTDSLRMPSQVNAAAENLRAEILGALETLEEEGVVSV